MTPLAAATLYLERGLIPIPIPTREKAPKLDGWPSLRLKRDDLAKHFNGAPQNLGIILGDDFGTLDIDLDCDSAIAVAGELLPHTAMVFGRQSKPRSHYFYRSDPPVRSKRYLDPVDRACLVELRCRKADGTTGLQTVVPPSLHPSGEEIRFEPGGDGHPANVEGAVIQGAASKVAAAALLARHWPAEKHGRNAAFIALAGALARGGVAIEEAIAFHRALYRALWRAGADFTAAEAEVRATYEKHAQGAHTTGGRSLIDLVDKRAARTALEWLGCSQPAPEPTRPRVQPIGAFDLENVMEDTEIQTPELIVEGFLPKQGLVLLGGRPKDGKSWFACQTALSFASGNPLGGYLRVREPGRVQLWCLEDQLPLTKDKVGKLLAGAKPPRGIQLFPELPKPILEGGDELLRATLDAHPAQLVILDSLFKLSGQKKPATDISQRDYDIIDRVRKIALEFGCVAVIVMHTKKGARGGDPIENIIGTSGTSAAADGVCELKRRGRNGTLTVVGRSVPHNDFQMLWHDSDQWGWSIESDGDGDTGETSAEVLAYLEAQGASKPSTIANALHRSFPSVWHALLRLQDRGLVVKGMDKRWGVTK